MLAEPDDTSEQYAAWYEAQVLAYNRKRDTTTQAALQPSTDFGIGKEEDLWLGR